MDAVSLEELIAIDGELSDEEKLIRDTTRRWVAERFLPVVAEHFENHTFPDEVGKEVAELGLFDSVADAGEGR